MISVTVLNILNLTKHCIMKTRLMPLLAFGILMAACNNEGKDSVEKADSANDAKMDSSATQRPAIAVDQETTDFLVHAANDGMKEVQLAQLAQQKTTDPKVKSYADKLYADHSAANDKVKTLAANRNVTLPATVGDKEKEAIADLDKKSGRDFDKAYIKAMVGDHKDCIDMFEKKSDKVNDSEVKAFIDNTLPTLKQHLDAAESLNKSLK